jgi:hypothetical protein
MKIISPFGHSLIVGLLYASGSACILIGFLYLRPSLSVVADSLHLGILVILFLILPAVSCYFASRAGDKPSFLLGLLGVVPAAIAFVFITYYQNLTIQTRQINYHGLGAPLGYVDPANLFATVSSFVPAAIWVLITTLIGYLAARFSLKQNG